MIRPPAVAGQFYEGRADALRRDVESRIDRAAPKEDAIGCVCPHAGYVYSGDVAGAVLSSINIPETVIVMSFSHRGLGERYAVWTGGAWRTPLGDVPVDEEISSRLIDGSPLLEPDVDAFAREHSGEVMLPFLQVLRPDVKIAMVSIHPAAPLDDLQSIGRDMAETLKDISPRPLLLASTDMTHFTSAAHAERMDKLAIDRMLALDDAGLYRVVEKNDISMCGVAPVTAMIACAKKLGATTARLVRYENSGKATGDDSNVVAYAGLTFK